MLFHIAKASDWAAASAAGAGSAYEVSTVGRTLAEEGFIHCSSSPEQVAFVLASYYTGVAEPLVLLTIDPALVGCEVRVEGGFPHVYGPLPVSAVVAVEPISG
jgi:uncharacterized protein (DUF952 family)